MDGLGLIVPFASPAAGANFSTVVPPGVRWKVHSGSALLTTNATVANRNPFLTFKRDSTHFRWAGGEQSLTLGAVPDFSVTASQAITLVFFDFQAEINDIFVNAYMPIPGKPLWLLSGTIIAITVQNMQTGDQLSNIGLAIEAV